MKRPHRLMCLGTWSPAGGVFGKLVGPPGGGALRGKQAIGGGGALRVCSLPPLPGVFLLPEHRCHVTAQAPASATSLPCLLGCLPYLDRLCPSGTMSQG